MDIRIIVVFAPIVLLSLLLYFVPFSIQEQQKPFISIRKNRKRASQLRLYGLQTSAVCKMLLAENLLGDGTDPAISSQTEKSVFSFERVYREMPLQVSCKIISSISRYKRWPRGTSKITITIETRGKTETAAILFNEIEKSIIEKFKTKQWEASPSQLVLARADRYRIPALLLVTSYLVFLPYFQFFRALSSR
jgi:hypothetical protein